MAGLFAAIGELAREAISDIRAEVVERGWFGVATDLAVEARELPETPLGVALQIVLEPTELASPELDEAPKNWDALCSDLAQERSSRGEPERELEPDIER